MNLQLSATCFGFFRTIFRLKLGLYIYICIYIYILQRRKDEISFKLISELSIRIC
jgi:hypothetical protein